MENEMEGEEELRARDGRKIISTIGTAAEEEEERERRRWHTSR